MTAATTGNTNKTLWEKGDFTRIATTMRTSGEDLVRRIGVGTGLRVLDVGCGDGTTAISAALAGATVRGVDIAVNLVAAGRARAEHLGVANYTFEEGDPSNLVGIEDASFDLVVNVFGAMFAPRPFDTAAEMVRVVRPGGRIVMGNWIPAIPPPSRRFCGSALRTRPRRRRVSSVRSAGASRSTCATGSAPPASTPTRSSASATPTSSTTPAHRRSSSACSGTTTGRR